MSAPIDRTASLWGSEDEFTAEMERRGLADRYQSMVARYQNRDKVQRALRENAFLRDLGFKPRDVRTGRARMAWSASQKLEDASDETFDRHAGNFVKLLQSRQELARLAQEAGVDAALSGKDELEGFLEFGRTLDDVPQEFREELVEHYRFGASQLAHLEEVMPVARKVFEFARDTEGFDLAEIEDSGEVFEAYGELDEEGRRKLGEALGYLAQVRGETLEQSTGLAANLTRGLRRIPQSVGQFFKGRPLRREAEMVVEAEELYVRGSEEDAAERIGDFEFMTAEEVERRQANPLAVGEEFHKLSAEELESAKKVARQVIGYTNLRGDLPEIRDRASEVKLEGFLMKAAGVTASSLPEMLKFVSGPTTVAVGFPSLFERQRAALRMRAPELTDEQLDALALPAGAAEAALGRLQFTWLFKRIPGLSNKLGRLGTGGKFADLAARTGAGTAAEVLQEYGQEQAMEVVLAAANVIDRELPNPRLAEVHRAFGEQFWEMSAGMMPLVAFGAGVEISIDRKTAAELAPFIGDPDILKSSGLTEEEAEQVLAETDGVRRAKKYREIASSKSAEEVAEQVRNTSQDVKRRAAEKMQGFEEEIPIEVTPEGRFRVAETGQEFQTAEEAGMAWQQHATRELDVERDATRELIEVFEQAEPDATVRDRPRTTVTLADAIEQGKVTREAALERIEIARRQGEQVPDDPAEILVQGENRVEMAGQTARIVIDLNKGSMRPLVAAQEMGEASMKRDIAEGRRDIRWFRDRLREVERQTGKKIFSSEDDAKVTDQEITEGVGEFVANYLAGEYDSKTLPARLKQWLRSVIRAIRETMRFAGDIKALRIKGELDEDWENWTRRALGLDEEYVMRQQEARVRREIAEEALGEEAEIQGAVRGLLPRNVEAMNDPTLAGEMESIWNHFRKTGQFRPGKFFARKGETVDLEKVREKLAEKGFAFETTGEMLDAVERSLSGESQFAGGETTFSIAPKIKPQQEAYGDYDWTASSYPNDKAPRGKSGFLGVVKERGVEGRPYADVKQVDHTEIRYGLNDARFRYNFTSKWLMWNDKPTEDQRIALQNWADKKGFVIAREGGWEMGTTFSLRGANDPLIEAIEKQLASKLTTAEFAEKMLKRVRRVRDRFEARKLAESHRETIDEAGNVEVIPERTPEYDHLALLADLSTLNAIAGALPAEIRKSVGTPQSLANLKTEEAREIELSKRITTVEVALRQHLLSDYKERTAKLLNRAQAKRQDNRTLRGKIGVAGHAYAATAKEAQKMTMEQATMRAVQLEQDYNEMEDAGEMELWKLDARKRALHVFYDWENASLERVKMAYEQLDEEYLAGRQEWLRELAERKATTLNRIAENLEFMGAPAKVQEGAKVPEPALSKARDDRKRPVKWANDMLIQLIGSGHHKLARIFENARNKEAARDAYNRLVASRAKAETTSGLEQHATQEALFDAVAREIGGKGANRGYLIKKFLYEAKEFRENNITMVEGEQKRVVNIPKSMAEGILAGTETGELARSLSESDMALLERAWEEYEELSDAQKKQRQNITFTRTHPQGERVPLGKRSYGDALQLWLTLRQPDQFEKLESMGYDEQTMAELEEFLPESHKRVGLWMVEFLKKEGDRINEIHEREYGVSMVRPENYFRVRNVVSDEQQELSQEVAAIHAGVAPKALSERHTNRARPDIVNAYANFLGHTAEMSYWKHNVQWVREWAAVFKNPRFRDGMKAYVGERAYSELINYFNTVQNHGAQQGEVMTEFEKIVKNMIRRYSMSILGLRVSTMFINATSMLNAFTADIPARKVMRNFVKMWMTDDGSLKATWSNDLQRLRRKYGASFEAAIAMKEDAGGRPVIQSADKLAQTGLVPMNYIDVAMGSLTTAAIYQTVLDERRAQGASEEDARREADDTVTRVVAQFNQPVLPVSRSRYEQLMFKRPLLALFVLFLSEVRMHAANNYMAWRTLGTGRGTVDRKTAARQAFVYTLVFPAVVTALRELYKAVTRDEDDEEWWERVQDPKYWTYQMLSDQLRPVPIGGEAAMAWIAEPLEQRHFDSGTPWVRSFHQMRKISATGDEDKTPGERVDAMFDAAQGLGAIVPGTTILAEGANLGEFAKGVAENGSFPDLEARQRVAPLHAATSFHEKLYDDTRGIEDEREKQVTRWIALAEKYREIRNKYPEHWPRVAEILKEKRMLPKDVEASVNGAPLPPE